MIFLVTFVVKLLFSFSKVSAISAAIADHIRLTCLMFLTFVVATITYIATKSVFYNLKRDGFYYFFCLSSATKNKLFFFIVSYRFGIYYIFVCFLAVLPKIVTAPPYKDVVEGSNLNLFCNATGNPQPDITWTKEGKSSVLSTSETLALTNLSSEDNGAVYICKVNNSLGFDEANATISVLCEYTYDE